MNEPAPTSYDTLVVLDFEATCDRERPPRPQEIIELPSVLVSLRPEGELDVVDAFETFVRPTHHPALTEFCTELTGITQADVDGAPTFPEALDAHRAWLEGHHLLGADARPFAFLTCGDWDLRTMLPAQLDAIGRSPAALPAAYRRWINVKRVFRDVTAEKGRGMPQMLEALGLSLEGRHHRGIDDCHNIAKIVAALHARGARFAITSERHAA